MLGEAGWIVTEEDRRAIGSWAADCAERVLPLFAAKAASDARPGEAIEAIRAYARGSKRNAQLRSVVWAALAAARAVGDPAAAAAARAAGVAAGTAYIHPGASLGTTKHALGPAAYAAWARELAALGDPTAASEEIRWAIEHAPAAVRELLRRMPVVGTGRGRFTALLHELEVRFRR